MQLNLKLFGLSGFFFVIGFIIMLEHFLNYGVWFQLDDIHHETFVLASFALGIGVILGSKLSIKK
jgi:hypothetical protein